MKTTRYKIVEDESAIGIHKNALTFFSIVYWKIEIGSAAVGAPSPCEFLC
jgi:hypothetical protein